MKDTKWTLVCEYMKKCESGQNMWECTDVEDETLISETGKQGTGTICTVCSIYSTYSVQYM